MTGAEIITAAGGGDLVSFILGGIFFVMLAEKMFKIFKHLQDKGLAKRAPEPMDEEDSVSVARGTASHVWEKQLVSILNGVKTSLDDLPENLMIASGQDKVVRAISELKAEVGNAALEQSRQRTVHGGLLNGVSGSVGTIQKQNDNILKRGEIIQKQNDEILKRGEIIQKQNDEIKELSGEMLLALTIGDENV